MLVHSVPGTAGDLTDHDAQPCVGDLLGSATLRTDDVVVVRPLAGDVGVLAGRQVQALDGAELLEDLERPEDRRSPDVESSGPCLDEELAGREMPITVRDQPGQPPAWLGQPVAGAIEGGDDRTCLHDPQPSTVETVSQHEPTERVPRPVIWCRTARPAWASRHSRRARRRIDPILAPREAAYVARPGRSRPLSTKTESPAPPSRRERRIAARANGAASPDLRQLAPRRRISPLIWITAAAGLAGLVLVGALLALQGGPKSVDVASLKAPIVVVPTELADGRSLGKADAPVTLEVWSDYQCPACQQFAEIVEPSLITNYVTGGTLRIIDHDAAFQGARSGSSYDESVEAGAGARCAADQDAYWAFHNWLFANQVGENKGAFRDERLRAIATAAGLDVAAWDACRATGEQQAAVRAETQQGVDLGVNATPTMYLNGQAIVGVKSVPELSALIEAAATAAAGS